MISHMFCVILVLVTINVVTLCHIFAYRHTLDYIHFQSNSMVTFTNLVCEEYDKDFASFNYCYVKAINRTYKYLSMQVSLHKGPISNVTVGVALLKRENGWKPFLYNVSFDGCKFLKSTKTNSVIKFLMSTFVSYTNINHTCPFDVSMKCEHKICRLNENRFYSA